MGELDAETAPRPREELTGLIDGGVRTVTVDLAQLRFIGSTGLSVLMSGQKRMLDRRGEFTLRSPSSIALRMFEVAGLTELFTISQVVPDPR
ncbi:MAG: STAS domain-containing protein [Actinomycetota bacterium]|nr:STAS domain-containing protein [Actinomycetota bacterium]